MHLAGPYLDAISQIAGPKFYTWTNLTERQFLRRGRGEKKLFSCINFNAHLENIL